MTNPTATRSGRELKRPDRLAGDGEQANANRGGEPAGAPWEALRVAASVVVAGVDRPETADERERRLKAAKLRMMRYLAEPPLPFLPENGAA